MNIDVIIKSHEKDYEKLPFVIDSLRHIRETIDNIYLINRDRYNPLPENNKITVVHDDEVFPGLDRSRLGHRPNWCFMSLIGIFNELTENEYYLDIQSDNIFLKPISFLDDNPVFFMSRQHSHYHKPYFNFSQKLYGFDRIGRDSFIVDFMLYKREFTREMLMGKSLESFFDRVVEITNDKCYIGDYELYPNWCLHNKPGYYKIKQIETELQGKYDPDNYTKQDIENILNQDRPEEITSISLHTWKK